MQSGMHSTGMQEKQYWVVVATLVRHSLVCNQRALVQPLTTRQRTVMSTGSRQTAFSMNPTLKKLALQE